MLSDSLNKLDWLKSLVGQIASGLHNNGPFFQRLLLILAVGIAYGTVWWSAWWLPKQLEVIKYVASWFLPAGVRLTVLAVMPVRLWPGLLLGEMAAMLAVDHPVTRREISGLNVISACLPMLCYALPVYWLRRAVGQIGIDRVRVAFWLVLAVALAAIVWGAVMSGLLVLGGQIPVDRFVVAWGGIAVGDTAAATLILPLTLLLVNRSQLSQAARVGALEQTVIFTQGLFLILLLVATYAAEFIQLAKFVALVPLMFLPYRFGWVGSVAAIMALNIVILVAYLVEAPFGSLIDNQMYLAFGSLSALLLGAAISEQQGLLRQVSQINDELRAAVVRLEGQRRQSEQLAGRVVAIQEEERQVLSRELHDGIGQQASALRVNLSVLRKRLPNPNAADVLDAMDSITASMYAMADELVHRLRPRVLDDLGLCRALQSPELLSQLSGKGIDYHATIDIDESALGDELSIAIYRLTQECVNNAVKHSAARNLWLTLSQERGMLHLSIRDDGVGIALEGANSGLGLTTIRDRVTALGGSYHLESDHRGTHHSATFAMHGERHDDRLP